MPLPLPPPTATDFLDTREAARDRWEGSVRVGATDALRRECTKCGEHDDEGLRVRMSLRWARLTDGVEAFLMPRRLVSGEVFFVAGVFPVTGDLFSTVKDTEGRLTAEPQSASLAANFERDGVLYAAVDDVAFVVGFGSDREARRWVDRRRFCRACECTPGDGVRVAVRVYSRVTGE